EWPVAGADERELRMRALEGGQRFQEEVESLLPGKPAAHAEEQRLRFDSKTETALERRLVLCAPRALLGVVASRQLQGGRRVPPFGGGAVTSCSVRARRVVWRRSEPATAGRSPGPTLCRRCRSECRSGGPHARAADRRGPSRPRASESR